VRDDDDDEAEFQRLQRAVSVHPSRVKSRRKRDQFVKVPLWWAGQAAQATGSPKAFLFPNGQLRAHGVRRDTKYHALRALEGAGLIRVTRKGKKTPVVTLLYK